MPTQITKTISKTKDLDPSTDLVRPVVKPTTPQTTVSSEQTQRTDHLPETYDQKDKIKSNRELPKATQMGMFKLQPKH